jgi:hypothetical protein
LTPSVRGFVTELGRSGNDNRVSRRAYVAGSFYLSTNNARRLPMSVATVNNGRPRKQLSNQLDRLDEQLLQVDRVLDALSDGLDGAVRDATKEGTRMAVKEAIVELLTSPDLRQALHHASTLPAEAKPSFWSRLKSKVRQTVTAVKDGVVAAATAVASRVARAGSALGRLVTKARASSKFRTAAKIVVGVGAAAAIARYAAGRGVGTMFLMIKMFVVDRVVRIKDWVRSSVLRLDVA